MGCLKESGSGIRAHLLFISYAGDADCRKDTFFSSYRKRCTKRFVSVIFI